MNQALKAGFQNFAYLRSFAVFPRYSKAGPLVSVKRRMGSKRLSSSYELAKSTQAEKGVLRDDAVKVETYESEILEDNLDTVERMTVQQLRLKLRSFGIPPKGCKRDLVCALKTFLSSKEDAQPNCSESISKQEVKSLSAEDLVQNVAAVSEVKHTKRKVSSEITHERVEASKKVVLSATEGEPWTILAHKKPQAWWVPYDPRNMRPPPLADDINSVKLLSWNVNGLRALLKMKGFSALQLAQREDFDVLCLQETKLQEKDVEAIKHSLLEGYGDSFWTCSVSKLGYSGTAIISRIKPVSVRYGLGIPDHDSEGRLVTVEFDTFYLLSGYVPNSGDGLKRLSYRVGQWDPSLSNYVKDLEKSKPVILTGDLNCAHQEIDIYDPTGNRRSAGFTEEERQSFEANFLNRGFVDTFRRQHPGVVAYTYWGYRHGGRKSNKGWRLDYFLASESIADNVHDSYILPDITGSDHSPIGLILKL